MIGIPVSVWSQFCVTTLFFVAIGIMLHHWILDSQRSRSQQEELIHLLKSEHEHARETLVLMYRTHQDILDRLDLILERLN